MGVLRAAKDLDAELPVIVMTAHGSIQDAVEAMKQGALDFLAKPVDPDHLLLLVSRALEQRRLLGEYRLLKEEAAARRGGPSIIGDSPALAPGDGRDRSRRRHRHHGAARRRERHRQGALRARAAQREPARQRAVRGDQLRGDSGEPARGRAVWLRARRLHRRQRSARSASSRWRSAAPSSSTRSARCRSRCRPRCCARSRPSGSSGSAATPRFTVDVRIVAATNRMLRQAVASRQFREDLYFRLSVFPVTVPPLRERKEDIPKLAHHFVERVARDVGKKVTLSPEALAMLVEHSWPGNVRELQNAIERAVILADGDRLLPRHLNLTTQKGATARIRGTCSTGRVRSRMCRRASRPKRRSARSCSRCSRRSGDKGRAADLLADQLQDAGRQARSQYGHRTRSRRPIFFTAALISFSLTSVSSTVLPRSAAAMKCSVPATTFLSRPMAARPLSRRCPPPAAADRAA